MDPAPSNSAIDESCSEDVKSVSIDTTVSTVGDSSHVDRKHLTEGSSECSDDPDQMKDASETDVQAASDESNRKKECDSNQGEKGENFRHDSEKKLGDSEQSGLEEKKDGDEAEIDVKPPSEQLQVERESVEIKHGDVEQEVEEKSSVGSVDLVTRNDQDITKADVELKDKSSAISQDLIIDKENKQNSPKNITAEKEESFIADRESSSISSRDNQNDSENMDTEPQETTERLTADVNSEPKDTNDLTVSVTGSNNEGLTVRQEPMETEIIDNLSCEDYDKNAQNKSEDHTGMTVEDDNNSTSNMETATDTENVNKIVEGTAAEEDESSSSYNKETCKETANKQEDVELMGREVGKFSSNKNSDVGVEKQHVDEIVEEVKSSANETCISVNKEKDAEHMEEEENSSDVSEACCHGDSLNTLKETKQESGLVTSDDNNVARQTVDEEKTSDENNIARQTVDEEKTSDENNIARQTVDEEKTSDENNVARQSVDEEKTSDENNLAGQTVGVEKTSEENNAVGQTVEEEQTSNENNIRQTVEKENTSVKNYTVTQTAEKDKTSNQNIVVGQTVEEEKTSLKNIAVGQTVEEEKPIECSISDTSTEGQIENNIKNNNVEMETDANQMIDEHGASVPIEKCSYDESRDENKMKRVPAESSNFDHDTYSNTDGTIQSMSTEFKDNLTTNKMIVKEDKCNKDEESIDKDVTRESVEVPSVVTDDTLLADVKCSNQDQQDDNILSVGKGDNLNDSKDINNTGMCDNRKISSEINETLEQTVSITLPDNNVDYPKQPLVNDNSSTGKATDEGEALTVDKVCDLEISEQLTDKGTENKEADPIHSEDSIMSELNPQSEESNLECNMGMKRKLEDLDVDSMYDENSKDVMDMETDEKCVNNEGDEKDDPTSDTKSQSNESAPTPAKRFRQSIALMNAAQGLHRISAHQLFEYQWPADGGEYYILQEQISEFLGVKSFKRKYPDLFRRAVDLSEREFLREKGVVTETQCDLGLTALKGEEVYDLMHKDYPDQYKEYADVLHEREKQKIKNKQKGYEQPKLEKSKMREYVKKAMKSAYEYNKLFNKKRREERRAYFDLQTYAIHYPQNKWKTPTPEETKPSIYPVALIPGQFQEYYKPYTPDELKYYPVRSTLYGPPKNMQSSDCEAEANDDAEESNEEGDESGTDEGSEEESSSDSDDDMTLEQFRSKERRADREEEKEEVETQEEHKCKICKLGAGEKVDGKIQELIQCSECKSYGHSTCFEITPDIVSVIKTYPWQCMECKTCVECMDPYDEDKMMFCDRCDRGYHTFCVGLKSIPKGHWECVSCKAPSTPPPKPRRGRPPLNRSVDTAGNGKSDASVNKANSTPSNKNTPSNKTSTNGKLKNVKSISGKTNNTRTNDK